MASAALAAWETLIRTDGKGCPNMKDKARRKMKADEKANHDAYVAMGKAESDDD